MKYSDLYKMVGCQGYFDLASVVQLSGECRGNICTQLHRWCKAGKLLPLRRGMYAFAGIFAKETLNPAELSNNLYRPSYISLEWALGYYGLIPEKVVRYTNVTTRQPKSFENVFGFFRYRNIKQTAFFGYTELEVSKKKMVIAEPEKALLDFFHLSNGKWDMSRMSEMRFQNSDLIDLMKIKKYSEKFSSPRLTALLRLWQKSTDEESEGEIIV